MMFFIMSYYLTYKQLDGVRGYKKEIHVGVALCDDENVHGTLDGVRGKYRVQLWRRLYSSCWDSKMHFLQWPMLINKTLSLRAAGVRTSFSTAQLHCGRGRQTAGRALPSLETSRSRAASLLNKINEKNYWRKIAFKSTRKIRALLDMCEKKKTKKIEKI